MHFNSEIILDSCARCSISPLFACLIFSETQREFIAILTWICSIFKHEHRRFTLTVNPHNYHKTSLHDNSTPVAPLVLLFLKIRTLFPLNVAKRMSLKRINKMHVIFSNCFLSMTDCIQYIMAPNRKKSKQLLHF